MDENASNHDELAEPDFIAAMIRERLATAMEEMDALTALLEGEEVKT
jgi:type I restriction enzyme M protein